MNLFSFMKYESPINRLDSDPFVSLEINENQ